MPLLDSWTCIGIDKGGGLLPDELMYALKMAACTLHLEKKKQLLFQSDECDGLIKTDWTDHLLGTRSGILFRAEVSSNAQEWQVNFLLHERDLEHGARILEAGGVLPDDSDGGVANFRLPLEALYQFEDLRPRTLN